MESPIARLNKVAPRRIRAQAAMWVTELHGPDRGPELERRARRWIAEDARHAAAFELATEAWERSGNMTQGPARIPLEALSTRNRPRFLAPAVAAAAVLCCMLIATVVYLQAGVVATGGGERRTVELSDGTQVALNANSRLLLQFDAQARKVTLARGEAMFTVKKHQSRPFVVVIDGRKIIALGTAFMVRREEPDKADFVVTLIEGRVAVEPLAAPDVLPADLSAVNVLTPGQRLRYAGEATTVTASPSLDKLTAWQRGDLIFDDLSLAEAAAEFNRYGSQILMVESAAARRLRVGGVFRIADPDSFALAMANAYHLQIIHSGRKIILTDGRSTDQKINNVE